jgi:hypothetical protein
LVTSPKKANVPELTESGCGFHLQQLVRRWIIAKQDTYVSLNSLSELLVNFPLANSDRMWQQSHLTVQKDRPEESYVQQNVQYFIENEIAENGRPNHVSDDVVLVSSRLI